MRGGSGRTFSLPFLFHAEPGEDFLVRRTEGVFAGLLRQDPAYGVMLQKLRLAAFDLRVKERQMDREIRIGMRQFHIRLADTHEYIEFLPAFTPKRRLSGFARLDFSADKFPKQSACFMRRTLADQKAARLLRVMDERCNNFDHILHLDKSFFLIVAVCTGKVKEQGTRQHTANKIGKKYVTGKGGICHEFDRFHAGDRTR